MKLLQLTMTRGSQVGQTTVLQPGQTLAIGRAESSQIVLSQDPLASTSHAKLEILQEGECRLTDLGSMNGTFVNGSRIDTTMLLEGDFLRIGRTEWTVERATAVVQTAQPSSASASRTSPSGTMRDIGVVSTASAQENSQGPDSERMVGKATDLIDRFPGVEVLAAMGPLTTPETRTSELIAKLVKDNRSLEALTVLAYALVPQAGVWWVCQSIKSLDPSLTEADQSRLRLAELWVKQSEERHRREAMAAAESDRLASPSAWACVAAFWSGDNIAPEGSGASVKPGSDLTGKGLMAALQICVARIPEKTVERNTAAIELGLKVARGELNWAG